MFLAHLPAGYLLSRGLLALPALSPPSLHLQRRLLITGSIASILPDFDAIYFYLGTEHGVSHRAFPSHWPPVWMMLFVAGALVAWRLRRVEWQWHNLFLFANVQLHFLLDTVAGPIRWLAPFDQTKYELMHVPRQAGWWVWSYAMHISALIEILIIAAAGCLAWRTARQHTTAIR